MVEKHKETFWIKADSVMIDDVEHFVLKSIIHTKNPLQNQLVQLISEGVVTMDHLIKRVGTTGSAQEKGPLFKIKPSALGLLFPEPKEYIL